MKSVKTVALLVFAFSLVPASGGFADDAVSAYQVVGYIKIPGIQGSSKNTSHLGWIELHRFSIDQGKACWMTTNGSWTVFRPPSRSSGEAKLAAMCNAHVPIAEVRIDVPGAPSGPHLLQNVVLVACTPVGLPPGGEAQSFRYSNCALHHKPPPAS